MSKTKLTPLSDRIVVKPITPDMTTQAGIILLSPQEDPDAPKKGIVLEVGTGRNEEAMILKPGDQILYSPYAGITIHVNKMEVLVMRQTDAIVKYEEEA